MSRLDAAETFEILGGVDDSADCAAATTEVANFALISGPDDVGVATTALVIRKPWLS